jgi:hypothetical protein
VAEQCGFLDVYYFSHLFKRDGPLRYSRLRHLPLPPKRGSAP